MCRFFVEAATFYSEGSVSLGKDGDGSSGLAAGKETGPFIGQPFKREAPQRRGGCLFHRPFIIVSACKHQ